MNYLLQRLQSYLTPPAKAQEKVADLLIELRHRGLNFNIKTVQENGQKYLYAQSVDYPRGHIAATGKDLPELEQELKDAIFAAFEVPVQACDPGLIVFDPPLAKNATVSATNNVHVAA